MLLLSSIASSPTAPMVNAAFRREFEHYYKQRDSHPGRDVPDSRRDVAVDHDLTLMISTAKNLLRSGQRSKAVENAIETSCQHAIRTSSDPRDPSWAAGDESGSIGLKATQLKNLRFIVARMGTATKMAAFDSRWRKISLPREFEWNVPWDPWVNVLPSGLVLVNEDGVEAMGSRDGVRLVWLRIKGISARVVGRFEGETILEEITPQISGNRVTLTTADKPKCFYTSATVIELPHRRTWDCSGVPKIVRDERLLPGVRAVDEAIWNAWRAKSRTPFQKRLHDMWPNRDDEGDWTETRHGETGQVQVGNFLVFELRYNKNGIPRIVGMREQRTVKPHEDRKPTSRKLSGASSKLARTLLMSR